MKKNEFPLSRVAEIKVSYLPHFKASERPKLTSSQQVYTILLDNWDLGLIELQEQFKIILLNQRCRVLGICEVSRGGITGTIVDAKIIFGIALKAGACAIILAHNHPSGNLKPSKSDLQLTEKIWQGGKLLDISVYDHLIISADGFLSFAKENLM
ncbi:MAG: JAB domain-containing protein [Bacteroidota bacterium]